MPDFEAKLEYIHKVISPFSGNLCIALARHKFNKTLLIQGIKDLEEAVVLIKELLQELN